MSTRTGAWTASLLALTFLPITVAVPAGPAAAQDAALTVTTYEGHPAVVLPPGYDTMALASDHAERDRVTTAAIAAVEAADAAPEQDGDVVFILDAAGEVMEFDADRAPRALDAAGGDLRFTFNSPAYPFTAEQLADIQRWIADFYPVVVGIYGPPSHGISVNVRHDPTIGGAGYFAPGANQIILSDPTDVDVFVHEMVHAFHDDDIIASTWEETMARAVEIEAFNQVGAYPHWDEHHSYHQDVWTDAVNAQAALGSTVLGIGGGFPNPFLRYNVGGYEWWKVWHAYPDFFRLFNQAVYAEPRRAYKEAALVEVAAAAAPVVENLPFTLWYITKGVFNSAPPQGPQLVTFQSTAWLIRQDVAAQPIAGAPATWTSQAFDGRVMASGSSVTTRTGAISVAASLAPDGYLGRVLLTYTATVGTDVIRASTWLSGGAQRGVFGVAPGLDTGEVRIVSLADQAIPPTTVPLAGGAFEAPSLETAVGSFRATLIRPDGTIAAERYFTKDAARFALILENRPTPIVNVKPVMVTGPKTVAPGTSVTFAVPVKSVASSTAPPSSTRLLLSVDDTRDAADIALSPLAVAPAVRAGELDALDTTVDVPATTPAGTYRALSCVDDNRLIPETNESDNCKVAGTITVAVPRPNLVVASLDAPPAKVRRGAGFMAHDSTRNAGDAAVAASTTRYLLSTDRVRGSGDIVLKPGRPVAAMGPSEQSVGSTMVTVPWATPAGRLYWLLACADDAKVIGEANEGDNCRVSGTQVKVTYV